MEEYNLLKKLGIVKAPPDFEQKVMDKLFLRRGQLKTRYLRLSLAGAFSAIVVLFIVLNFFILPQKSSVKFAGFEKGISSSFQKRERITQREIIPIIESVDYKGEIRSVSRETSTVYILEQISEETSTEINY